VMAEPVVVPPIMLPLSCQAVMDSIPSCWTRLPAGGDHTDKAVYLSAHIAVHSSVGHSPHPGYCWCLHRCSSSWLSSEGGVVAMQQWSLLFKDETHSSPIPLPGQHRHQRRCFYKLMVWSGQKPLTMIAFRWDSLE
jgi:hypothetical protein